jgi:ankyrin repeat protein
MKTRRNNKRSRKHGRKTRSNRQRGSGASCSRPMENIDMTDEQLALNDALKTAIVGEEPDRVKQLLDEGAHATITINDDYGTRHGMPVETIPAIMYVARHVKDPNTIIMNHLLNADSNLNVQGGCAVSRMGTTLLSEAAEWSNIDMMRELLKMGSDINDASHRPPALSYAVLNQDINMVNFIIDERKGQVNLTYDYHGTRNNIIEEALEQHENAQDETWPYQDETEIERTQEIIETLKRYAVKQSIMSVDDFNTKCEKSQGTGKTECGILMDEITNKTAVMPHQPMTNTSDDSTEMNTAVCFDRSALQTHLVNRLNNPRIRPPIFTNPVTNVEISQHDIDRMYPLGLNTDYTTYIDTLSDTRVGGKSKRKTRKHNKKSRKHRRKTRMNHRNKK